MKITSEIMDLINNKTACGIDENEDSFTIYVDNACGEDFQFDIEKGDNEVEDIIQYCCDYDEDEHFDLWWGANNGEPRQASVLARNCHEIGENLEQMADLLREVL